MSQQVYAIRRALVIPLGVDAFLLLALFAIALFIKGDLTERLVFAIFLIPALYLFLESLLRQVTVTQEGLCLRTLWKVKTVLWGEITHVGCLCLHRKVYLLLTTLKGIFIVSNVYEEFPVLVEVIVERVGLERVEEEVRHLSGRSRAGHAPVIWAWIVAVFMVGIILMKMGPSC